MSANPLKRLTALGQSVWFDYIRRDLYQGPELKRLIEEDGLRGMTSNPTIFQKAIAETQLYDDDIRRLAANGASPAAIVESLAVEDVRRAADMFRPVHERTRGDDGFVSIEVRPQLARDTEGSIAEARWLWKECNRPNIMVKIPATHEGIAAIHRCLSEGININITLLFSVSRYREVMEAYLLAMEERLAAGWPVNSIRSVASFFVSRVDSNVDKKLDAIAKAAIRSDRERQLARDLRGKIAIANARIAYEAFEKMFRGSRFDRLREKGVRLQRPLWASTSTKDPSYPDLYYVEALVAPNSVDTMPPETFEAYRDHGDPKIRIHDGLLDAHSAFRSLAELGIDEQRVSRELEEEGARKFSESIGKILRAVEEKEKSINATR
ncbi:MAG: transaldolase [Terriglobia bacterium]